MQRDDFVSHDFEINPEENADGDSRQGPPQQRAGFTAMYISPGGAGLLPDKKFAEQHGFLRKLVPTTAM
jgi:hypothetical protein